MKLGNNLWNYIIVHKDYWGRSYGVSFTHLSDFPKRFKYDMENMPDNMEDIIKKDKKDESNTTAS